MYVTAAEQTKVPSDSKENFFPWEVRGRGGRGKVVLRAERLGVGEECSKGGSAAA